MPLKKRTKIPNKHNKELKCTSIRLDKAVRLALDTLVTKLNSIYNLKLTRSDFISTSVRYYIHYLKTVSTKEKVKLALFHNFDLGPEPNSVRDHLDQEVTT